MRNLLILVAAVALACRGENPPRDYQNAPPAMTHPPQKKGETPAAKGMPGPPPEPSHGAEGKTTQPVTATVTTTVKDQAPVTKTNT